MRRRKRAREARRILVETAAAVEYHDWTFTIADDPDAPNDPTRFHLLVRRRGLDSNGHGQKVFTATLHGGINVADLRIPEGVEESALHYILDSIRSVEAHETGEFFRYRDGVRPFLPAHQPDGQGGFDVSTWELALRDRAEWQSTRAPEISGVHISDVAVHGAAYGMVAR